MPQRTSHEGRSDVNRSLALPGGTPSPRDYSAGLA